MRKGLNPGPRLFKWVGWGIVCWFICGFGLLGRADDHTAAGGGTEHTSPRGEELRVRQGSGAPLSPCARRGYRRPPGSPEPPFGRDARCFGRGPPQRETRSLLLPGDSVPGALPLLGAACPGRVPGCGGAGCGGAGVPGCGGAGVPGLRAAASPHRRSRRT